MGDVIARRVVRISTTTPTEIKIPDGRVRLSVTAVTVAGAVQVNVSCVAWRAACILGPVGTSEWVVWPVARGLPSVIVVTLTQANPVDVIIDQWCDDA